MNLHEEISRVAYELYERRGRMGGHDRNNWLEAEKIAMKRHAAEEKIEMK
jgi:hypothetical protein